mgnify:CR=1 FL=1
MLSTLSFFIQNFKLHIRQTELSLLQCRHINLLTSGKLNSYLVDIEQQIGLSTPPDAGDDLH